MEYSPRTNPSFLCRCFSLSKPHRRLFAFCDIGLSLSREFIRCPRDQPHTTLSVRGNIWRSETGRQWWQAQQERRSASMAVADQIVPQLPRCPAQRVRRRNAPRRSADASNRVDAPYRSVECQHTIQRADDVADAVRAMLLRGVAAVAPAISLHHCWRARRAAPGRAAPQGMHELMKIGCGAPVAVYIPAVHTQCRRFLRPRSFMDEISALSGFATREPAPSSSATQRFTTFI